MKNIATAPFSEQGQFGTANSFLTQNPLDDKTVSLKGLVSGDGSDYIVIPSTSDTKVTVDFSWFAREAAYDNEVGVYLTDAQGRVGGVDPTDLGYAQAVLTSATRKTLFMSGQHPLVATEATFNGGDILAFYLIQNSTAETWLNTNPQNTINEGLPLAFFSVNAANPDHFDHVHGMLGSDGIWQGQWEDLTYGGDQDFNDVVFTAKVIAVEAVKKPQVSIGDIRFTEGDQGFSPAQFTATLSAAATMPVTVAYTTADGTAKAGIDYQATSGQLTFAPSETSKIIPVQIAGDTLLGADRSFSVTFSDPQNAVLTTQQAIATIIDNDTAAFAGTVTKVGTLSNTLKIDLDQLDTSLAQFKTTLAKAQADFAQALQAGEIRGIAWNDLNSNGVRDSNLIRGSSPDIAFIIDVSQSANNPFKGTPVGDLNKDGRANTILDAEIAGFIALNQQLIEQGLGKTAKVSVISFAGSATTLDMNPALSGQQLVTNPVADNDNNGILDVVQALISLRTAPYTNFEAALSKAETTFKILGTVPGNGNLIFLSDGGISAGGSITDEIARLNALGVNLTAFGIGQGAQLSSLKLINPNAKVLTSTDALLTEFSSTSGQNALEPGMAGVQVYLELNNNEQLDAGEPTQITSTDDPSTPTINERGQYRFTDLAPGTYTVREVIPSGYTQTFPKNTSALGQVAVLNAKATVENINFGNVKTQPDGTTLTTVLNNSPQSSVYLTNLFQDAIREGLAKSQEAAAEVTTVTQKLYTAQQNLDEITTLNQKILEATAGDNGSSANSLRGLGQYALDLAVSYTSSLTQDLTAAQGKLNTAFAALDAVKASINSYVTPLPSATNIFSFPTANQPLVGVIDTGFAKNNPDIDYSRITAGKDLLDGDADPFLTPGQGNEHGTAVLGVIAATRGNNIGIDGINDKAPVWVGRATGSGNWATSLREFVDAAKAANEPNAIALLAFDLTQTNPDGSVTTRDTLTQEEVDALTYARNNRILVVVAAGNQDGALSALGQASQWFDNVVTVGAATGTGKASYSSFGQGLTLVATGGDNASPVLSTVGNDVGVMVGTSIAAAEVAGAISEVWAANPALNYQQIITILKNTATDLGTPGYDPQTGAGRLNLNAAVAQALLTAPSTLPASSTGTIPILNIAGLSKNSLVERAADTIVLPRGGDAFLSTIIVGQALSAINSAGKNLSNLFLGIALVLAAATIVTNETKDDAKDKPVTDTGGAGGSKPPKNPGDTATPDEDPLPIPTPKPDDSGRDENQNEYPNAAALAAALAEYLKGRSR